MTEARTGDGWAATSLDELGDGPGFRKIRPAIGVTAFGMNAIVLPPGVETGRHYHDRQEEIYFLHRGRMEMEFGDGGKVALEPGGVVRGDASAPQRRPATRAAHQTTQPPNTPAAAPGPATPNATSRYRRARPGGRL